VETNPFTHPWLVDTVPPVMNVTLLTPSVSNRARAHLSLTCPLEAASMKCLFCWVSCRPSHDVVSCWAICALANGG
jgi:hypothetical protein